MKAILFSLFLLPAAGLFAQNDFIHVDYEQIGQAISDSNSVYYYPRLLELYKSGDTTLTTLDYFHLYYGATLQEGWSSMLRFEDEEARRILRKTSADTMELNMVKKALEEYLAQAPFDLDQIYDLMVVTNQLGQTEVSPARTSCKCRCAQGLQRWSTQLPTMVSPHFCSCGLIGVFLF